MQFGSFTGVKPASRNSFRLGPYYLFVSTRGTAVCLGNLWQVKVRTQDCFAVWTFELLSDLPPVSPNWKSPQISSWSWELAVYDKYNDWLVTTAVHLFVLISHHVGIPFQSPQNCGAFLETAVAESKRREQTLCTCLIAILFRFQPVSLLLSQIHSCSCVTAVVGKFRPRARFNLSRNPGTGTDPKKIQDAGLFPETWQTCVLITSLTVSPDQIPA
jgi:hypothetical protein